MSASSNMSAPIDLHIHTTYSDGKYPPEDILRAATRLGITTLAFTDHDNTRGYRAALPLAQTLGLELLPGIEFTCHWPHCDIPLEDDDTDLLGYCMNVDQPSFQAFEQATLRDVFERMTERCARVTQLGYPVTLDDVLVENPHFPGGLHLALTIQRKGYAATWAEAVAILDRSRDLLRSGSFSVYQAIEQIHLAGGLAILAHPTTLTGPQAQFQPEHLAMLVEMGLDGLEVYHPRVDAAARAYLLDIARQFDLLVTGGTDQHGWKHGLPTLGSQTLPADILTTLRQRQSERQSNLTPR
jgi:3',5'-nucleoside bisphosphate phosphatase